MCKITTPYIRQRWLSHWCPFKSSEKHTSVRCIQWRVVLLSSSTHKLKPEPCDSVTVHSKGIASVNSGWCQILKPLLGRFNNVIRSNLALYHYHHPACLAWSKRDHLRGGEYLTNWLLFRAVIKATLCDDRRLNLIITPILTSSIRMELERLLY